MKYLRYVVQEKTLTYITKHLLTGFLSKMHFAKWLNETFAFNLAALGNSLVLGSDKTQLPLNIVNKCILLCN